MLNKNDIVDIIIDDLTVDGAGVGRHDGFAVFVPRALPGETVSAKIIKVTKSYAVARLLDIKKPSKHRTLPFCDSFEKCGGCTLQHLDYSQQLKYKISHIQQCFKRIGGIDIDTPDVMASDNITDYRNKASFPVSEIDGRIQAGFFAPRSHRVIAGDCPIQKQSINDIKNAVIKWANKMNISAYNENKHTGVLRHIIGRQSSTGELMAGVVMRRDVNTNSLSAALHNINGIKSVVVNINSNRSNAILGTKDRLVFGDEYITEEYSGLSFRAGLSSFLQINHAQAEKLYQKALELADIKKDDILLDLFCGIGTITLLAAKKAARVLGIEYCESAVINARDNARLNNIDNAIFLAGDAGEKIDEGICYAGNPDIVMLDPPRKGCDGTLIDKIIGAAPKRVVYVSCNPASLARDAVQFIKQGYKLSAVQGVDMFPHTTHVECCCLFNKNV